MVYTLQNFPPFSKELVRQVAPFAEKLRIKLTPFYAEYFNRVFDLGKKNLRIYFT